MHIVTLTTDYGLRDYHLAALKGALLVACGPLHVVDVSHNISNYNIVQAAYLFRNAWPHFPEGSIHLLSVNDLDSPDKQFLALKHEGHFFVGPDNGLFSLIFDPLPEQRFFVSNFAAEGYPLRRIFADAVHRIIQHTDPAEWGQPAAEIVRRLSFHPVTQADQIRGTVIYVDNYENAVINISEELFRQIGRERGFQLFFKRHDPIVRLSRHYHDVPVGEPLCRFGDSGLLEIAVNQGKASTLLGLQVDDTVQIHFLDAPSKSGS